ncbi:carbohydrate sulfotransferase 4-like isoform X2 [Pararge aegeria]|uniref:carbohydrate sulfotransferase 4-like isoform X2 n=1 Tax=Pararge aegeria TaxID=116150 RepID=UPI0019D0C1E5|nr:carbohydrate sulfotransferase 4-like isoform X2 [Pararge aegeria]
MLRRVNFYSICIAFGLSVLLILAGSRYTDNTNYRPSESRRNIRNFLKPIEDVDESSLQPIPTNADDGTPDVDKILDRTRLKIKHELWNYNFTQSGVQNLDGLLMESGGQPFRSLIISTWRFCKLFPFQSMKVVRVRLRLVKQLLQDKELNLKVILLIRDPRGVMQSRQHRNFCQPAPDCWKPELLCADMISDYVAAARLKQEYPHRFMALRYEELALSPNSTSYALLKFLGLGITPSIDEFLHSHTNVEVAGVSSTFRVSRDVPFRWKNVLDFNYVDEIQMTCKEAMSLWGYRNAHNSTHMTSKDYNPLDQYSLTQ